MVNGRYRFKKVYGGLNWSRELRSPLTAPGVDVKAGEYLLAVRGVELKPPTELFSLFENTAEKSIEITVGPNPDGKGSRTVTVEPLAERRRPAEPRLGRRQPAAGPRGHRRPGRLRLRARHRRPRPRLFQALLLSAVATSDAIIIDERFNGGGQIADYYISHLCRPPLSMWATRYGEDTREPGAAIARPEGHAHRRDGRLRRRHAPLDVPQAAPRHAGGQADLGRAGRNPRHSRR